MKKFDSSGFSVVTILLVVVVLGAIGATGFFVYKQSGPKQSATTETETNESTEMTEAELAELNAKKDEERKSDLKHIKDGLECFFSNNGYYPSHQQLAADNWPENTCGQTSQDHLEDPEGNRIESSDSNYTYTPAPSECSQGACKTYFLHAKLSDGSMYELFSLE